MHRSSDEHDLREFRRRYAAETDWAHRRRFGMILSAVAAALAAALWRWAA